MGPVAAIVNRSGTDDDRSGVICGGGDCTTRLLGRGPRQQPPVYVILQPALAAANGAVSAGIECRGEGQASAIAGSLHPLVSRLCFCFPRSVSQPAGETTAAARPAQRRVLLRVRRRVMGRSRGLHHASVSEPSAPPIRAWPRRDRRHHPPCAFFWKTKEALLPWCQAWIGSAALWTPSSTATPPGFLSGIAWPPSPVDPGWPAPPCWPVTCSRLA